jgi:hypothetical protein
MLASHPSFRGTFSDTNNFDVMGDKQNPARTLTEKVWGTNFLDSIPAEWKSALRLLREKTPGVKNGSDPDTPTVIDPDNLEAEIIATSQVTTNRINELEKETTKIQWTLLLTAVEHGQERNRQFGIPIPFTRRLTLDGVGVGDADKTITPLNPILSVTEESDMTELETFLSTYSLKYTGRINVDLPDRLISVASVMESNSGDGASTEDGTAELTGNGSISLSLRATAQASASIIPKVFAKVQPFYGNNVKCTHVHIFLPAPVVDTDVTTRLATILGVSLVAWPKYNPVTEEIRVVGGRFSLQVSASSQGSASLGDTGSSSSAGGGTGYSEEKGLSVEIIRISPVIHGLINVSGTLSTIQALSADASSEAAGVGPAESISRSGSIAASVTPSSLAATAGTTAWPTTGVFLYRIDSEPFIENFVQFHCIVVNAADFPNN